MSSNFWAELSNDYEKLFKKEIEYDVIIYAGEEEDFKEIHAHSSILCARSQYFYTAFSSEWAEKKDGKFIFRKPNISPNLFNIILRFIYSGNIELKDLKGPADVFKLLIAADELNIQSLIFYIQEYLINHQTEYLYQDPIGIFEIVYQHASFTNLWKFFLEKIKILLSSDKFINLKAPLLESLLKRNVLNDLNVSEIEIWESLLKWCFAQQDITENDPTKWTNEDITKIENTLHVFIPLIRFHYIESSDFFYKVYNYKNILPKDLIHDLLEFYLVPNKSNINIDSTLITSDYIIIFGSWIDRKVANYNNKTNPYKVKLLYRASKDGFDVTSFHRNCDDKGATIWIAKIQDSTQLIGGYNPLDWNGNCWKSTTQSFLFNFTDGKDTSTAQLGYVKKENRAIYCNSSFGPKMGNLQCRNSKNWKFYSSTDYPDIDIPEDFMIEDYEVFQVIKKQKT
ncbi:hypothetical protein C1645_881527 [Glomus cerebriforme]|uniref:BTB/POZ domain-containing protein n=1 Tax=Glomus cerebriforme TaxID=658196 RepID=A0A397SBC7_9GLOM|nr:hypothetical protein C1645_881527 [Glomus cerebriforme]